MNKIILYHGTSEKIVETGLGLGNERHDYGRGFYLTESFELAQEWAVCRPYVKNGWVHTYELNADDLQILDFQNKNLLSWLAELMKHRDASDTKRYRILAEKFIKKYGLNTESYDAIRGWRADASYFYIAREFVRDNIDIDILEDLMALGDLGIQYCIKSEAAYANLHEMKEQLYSVNYDEFNVKYNQRDTAARCNMKQLINSDANKVEKVFSTLV